MISKAKLNTPSILKSPHQSHPNGKSEVMGLRFAKVKAHRGSRNIQLEFLYHFSDDTELGQQIVKIPNQPGHRIIIILDLPRLDNSFLDFDFLRHSSVWFASSYTKKMMFGGVIYPHNDSERATLITNLTNLFSSSLFKLEQPGIIGVNKQAATTAKLTGSRERQVIEIFWDMAKGSGCSVYRVPETCQSAWYMDYNIQRDAPLLKAMKKRMTELPNRIKRLFDTTPSVIHLVEEDVPLIPIGSHDIIPYMYTSEAPPQPSATLEQPPTHTKSDSGTPADAKTPRNNDPTQMNAGNVHSRSSASSRQLPTGGKSGPRKPARPPHNTDASQIHTDNESPNASTSSKQRPMDETSGSGAKSEPTYNAGSARDAEDAQNAGREDVTITFEEHNDNEVELSTAQNSDNGVSTEPSPLVGDVSQAGGMFHGAHDFNIDSPMFIESASITSTQITSQVANIVNSGNHIYNHIGSMDGNMAIPHYITAGASVITAGAALAIANSVVYKEPQPALAANVDNPTAMPCGEPELVREREERCLVPLNDLAATAALVECLRRYKYSRVP